MVPPSNPNIPIHWPAQRSRVPLRVMQPGSQAQDSELTPSADAASNGPLVSCLMVSRGNLHPARHAIECFQRQTYRQRELIIVDDNPASELTDYLTTLADPQIRQILLPAGSKRLGTLRNEAMAAARGELVCQWDDDDLYDARRLAWQVQALQTGGAQACFLRRWTLWWPSERRIALAGDRIWEGSMLARRAAVPRYPDQRRGEDSTIVNQIVGSARVVLMDAPELYCYTIHGGNTFHHQHFLSIYNASSEFTGCAAYDNYLDMLGRRVPIKAYAATLTQIAGANPQHNPQRHPPPPQLADRFIDPAHPRPGRAPSSNTPLVSIIVRSMGRPCLADALASLAAQTYRRIEVLIVDATGGRHPPLPPAIAADARFRMIGHGRPLKRPAAANAGLDAAAGEYIGFLDDDDLFGAEHVEVLVRRIGEPDHPELAYAGLWLIDRYHRVTQMQSRSFNTLLFQFFNLLPAISVLFHRRGIEIGCRFDESLEVFEDWDFWLQLASHVQMARVDAPTHCYFIEAGTSGTSIGLNADPARGGHFSQRVRKRWEPIGAALWRDYLAHVQDLLARFHDGERATLRPRMRSLLRRYPEEPNMEFHLGRTYLAQGHAFSARRLYESAVSHNRGSLEFTLSLVFLWESQGWPEDALACLEEARPTLTDHLHLVDPHILRLRRLFAARKPLHAASSATRIGRNDPCTCGSGTRYKHCCGRPGLQAAPMTPPPASAMAPAAKPARQTESDDLLATATVHYRNGDLAAAGVSLRAADAVLPGQAMVNHALALLACDQGLLDLAAHHADLALASGPDDVILSFHRQLHYRRRRITEAEKLRASLRDSGRLLPAEGVRQVLVKAGALVVLRGAAPIPLCHADFNEWPGMLHFLPEDATTLPLPAGADGNCTLIIDGVPELLPDLFDAPLDARVLVRVTRDCPAMLLEIAQAVPAPIGLIYSDETTARQVGLPGLVVRPSLPPTAWIAPRPVPGAGFHVGLRGSCQTDGLHPQDAMLIRRLLADGLTVSVLGGGALLRYFPPAAMPPGLRLHGFDLPPQEFLAGLDCLVLRRAPLADGAASQGYVAEALAAGCALICANNLPGSELIADGQNGFRVTADDEDTICARIALLRQDSALKQAIGSSARASAQEYLAACQPGRWTQVHFGLEDACAASN